MIRYVFSLFSPHATNAGNALVGMVYLYSPLILGFIFLGFVRILVILQLTGKSSLTVILDDMK